MQCASGACLSVRLRPVGPSPARVRPSPARVRTHVPVLHAADVRAPAAVRGRQGLLHAALQLVEADSETGEIVHLGRKAQTLLLYQPWTAHGSQLEALGVAEGHPLPH